MVEGNEDKGILYSPETRNDSVGRQGKVDATLKYNKIMGTNNSSVL